MIEKLANSEEGGVGDFPECKRRTVGVEQTEKKGYGKCLMGSRL